MAKDKPKAVNIMTPEFRASFVNVFRPGKPVQEGQEPKYSIVLLFEPGLDLSKPAYGTLVSLKQAAMDAIVDKWGPDKVSWPTGLRLPFRKQGEKKYDGYTEGGIYMTSTSKQKPGLVDASNTDIIDEHEFYSGCYARATVRAFAYDKAGNRGVAFGLQNVQKLRDGDPLSGRMKAQDEFSPVETDDLDSVSPTTDIDDLM